MVVLIMNKLYASRESAVPFDLVYRLGYEKESIKDKDFLDELFQSLLLEIGGRITGAELLLENDVGAVIDPDIADQDDGAYYLLLDIIKDADDDDFELIFNETCRLTAEKRLDALKTFYDAIDNLHKLFYNPNLKVLKNIAENYGDING